MKGAETFAERNSPSMAIDKTIMDNTGKGVAYDSPGCKALGIAGRSDVCVGSPPFSSSIVLLLRPKMLVRGLMVENDTRPDSRRR